MNLASLAASLLLTFFTACASLPGGRTAATPDSAALVTAGGRQESASAALWPMKGSAVASGHGDSTLQPTFEYAASLLEMITEADSARPGIMARLSPHVIAVLRGEIDFVGDALAAALERRSHRALDDSTRRLAALATSWRFFDETLAPTRIYQFWGTDKSASGVDMAKKLRTDAEAKLEAGLKRELPSFARSSHQGSLTMPQSDLTIETRFERCLGLDRRRQESASEAAAVSRTDSRAGTPVVFAVPATPAIHKPVAARSVGSDTAPSLVALTAEPKRGAAPEPRASPATQPAPSASGVSTHSEEAESAFSFPRICKALSDARFVVEFISDFFPSAETGGCWSLEAISEGASDLWLEFGAEGAVVLWDGFLEVCGVCAEELGEFLLFAL